MLIIQWCRSRPDSIYIGIDSVRYIFKWLLNDIDCVIIITYNEIQTLWSLSNYLGDRAYARKCKHSNSKNDYSWMKINIFKYLCADTIIMIYKIRPVTKNPFFR